MSLRAALPILLCVAALPGCASPGDGLLSAHEAIAIALEAHPRSEFLGAYGVEGPQLDFEDPDRAAFRDDHLPDGAPGDGRLSSWVVGLRRDGQFFEARAFPDGTAPVEKTAADPPHFLLDEQVFAPRPPAADSTEAARAALAATGCADVPAGPLGYRYSFSLHREVETWRSGDDAEANPDILDFGLSTEPSTWTVASIDMAPGPHAAAVVRLDGAGRALGCDAIVPLRAVPVFEESVRVDEPPTTAGTQQTRAFTFDVGPRATQVRGSFLARSWILGVQESADAPRVRLVDGAGEALFDGEAWERMHGTYGSGASGEWRLEVTTDAAPTGSGARSVRVEGSFLAYETLGP